ncbi:hypothetical protein C8Q74DRAFT_241544 [Fomes fomentarius]|nr:hypothetical protein C8Q74DRAFT_241544 [Fomes fomentarius]
MMWERVKDVTQNGRDTLSSGVVSLVGKGEEAAGLKLRETLSYRDHAAAAVKAKTVQLQQKEVKEAAEQRSSRPNDWFDSSFSSCHCNVYIFFHDTCFLNNVSI